MAAVERGSGTFAAVVDDSSSRLLTFVILSKRNGGRDTPQINTFLTTPALRRVSDGSSAILLTVAQDTGPTAAAKVQRSSERGPRPLNWSKLGRSALCLAASVASGSS